MVQTLLLECDSSILKGFQHNHAFFSCSICAMSQASVIQESGYWGFIKLAVTKDKIKEKKILCKVKVINYSINP
jgi:hypothetical protein